MGNPPRDSRFLAMHRGNVSGANSGFEVTYFGPPGSLGDASRRSNDLASNAVRFG
jgi:hypothetical protein